MTLLALGYRSLFIVILLALTAFSWFVVGGRAGALIWITSFLLLWGFTRVLDQLLGGFFLGSEVNTDQTTNEHEEV